MVRVQHPNNLQHAKMHCGRCAGITFPPADEDELRRRIPWRRIAPPKTNSFSKTNSEDEFPEDELPEDEFWRRISPNTNYFPKTNSEDEFTEDENCPPKTNSLPKTNGSRRRILSRRPDPTKECSIRNVGWGCSGSVSDVSASSWQDMAGTMRGAKAWSTASLAVRTLYCALIAWHPYRRQSAPCLPLPHSKKTALSKEVSNRHPESWNITDIDIVSLAASCDTHKYKSAGWCVCGLGDVWRPLLPMKGILWSPQTIRSIFSWVSRRKANKAWIRNCNIVAKRAAVEIQKSSHLQPLEVFQVCNDTGCSSWNGRNHEMKWTTGNERKRQTKGGEVLKRKEGSNEWNGKGRMQ